MFAEDDSTEGRREINGTPALEAFGTDLTKKAADGEIDPVIGREEEIERIAQILGRRKKNNPLLLGDPGVGKSAIVNGLALRIVDGNVPLTLQNKRIFSVDMSSIVAGTKYRGQFEERMKVLVQELKSNEDIIVFIDEIHTMVGAGGSSGSMDASNIIKPALASGEIQCIGATTYDEYRENIEGEGALDRRFQKVDVDEPTLEETYEILMQTKKFYEKHHSVTYSQDIIELIIELSDRYVSDRMFPDKALDILDEVGSRIHMKRAKIPESIIKLEEKLKKSNDDKRNAVLTQDYERAAEHRDKALRIKKEIEAERENWKENSKRNKTPVTRDEVLEVTSLMTGIPVSEVNEEETEKLAKMPDLIKAEVIGQDEAVNTVCTAIQRSRIGLARKNKPIGNFLFVGTTGTGKTLLAKSVARYLFGSEDSLIRFDMSEFMEKHSVSRLVGAPPGYVGYEEGGQLAELVKRKPYSVVLFDEIEKAHRDVYNTLLQVMDEGFMTDSLGRKVNFRNCVIIMTSNVGAKTAMDFGKGVGFSSSTDNQKAAEMQLIEKEMRRHFSPEFLNRIDEVVHFNKLERFHMENIVKLQLEDTKERVKEIGYSISFAKSAIDHLIDLGFDPKYGARSLARNIQNYVENKISDLVINKKIQKGDRISVTKKKGSNDFTLSVK